MTPDQLEHLKLIDAHLERLLAIAEKRTPGGWVHDLERETIGDVATPDGDAIAQAQERIEIAAKYGYRHRSRQNQQRNNNAAFIASCAGNAEAGWRATRAVIDWLIFMHDHGEGWRNLGLVDDILAAFPLELVKP